MAEIKITGVMRSGAFSPNHIGNDATIFNLVAEQLRKRGCLVNVLTEDEFANGAPTTDIIVDMCRERRSFERLQKLEDDGALVINSGYGIENCTRERMTRVLQASGIPYPETIIADTDEVVKDRLIKAGFEGCWIKRGENHTMHREDVTYARHPQEAQELIQEFFLRGIKRAVINRHIDGELIKFYGVADTPFFHWIYAFDSGKSNRTVGSQPEHTPFDIDKLRAACAKAADVLDVVVYGGDAIILPDGSFSIIDFNDWPSFGPCRAEAATVIARAIMTRIKNRS